MLSSLFPFAAKHRRKFSGLSLALLAFAVPVSGRAADASATAEVQFMRDIAPLLAQRCFVCHGAVEHENDLRLDIFERLTTGEHPAVAPGQPEESAIIARLTEEDSSSRMPRDDEPLPSAQIDMISRWIKAGAKFDGPDPKKPYLPTPKPSESAGMPAPHHVPPAAAQPAKEAGASSAEKK